MTARGVFFAAALACVSLPSVEKATAAQKTWPERKCEFYAKAWRELSGGDGVSAGFIKGNEAFIAAGCSNGADVCPETKADIDLANKLTMASMNFGTASSFLPFICRQDHKG
jgi:hypothetical protein